MDAETEIQEGAILDIAQIKSLIPHRYPFLLIDQVSELIVGESAVGTKNVTINEPYFAGHFPDKPIMPGVMIIEAMAQTAGVLVVYSQSKEETEKLVYFMAIDSARFRRPVVPGDTMKIHVSHKQNRGTVWKFRGEAKVDDVLVAEAVFTAMIVDK